ARDGLPPYMIAHNDSLMTMAKIKPQSPEELVQIKGFGEKRAQKYGYELLEIISNWQSENQ
nr:HRDC domain-containing protein [Acidobacteriota bacterium]